MTPDDPEARRTADILLTIGEVTAKDARAPLHYQPRNISEPEDADIPESEEKSGLSVARRSSVVEALSLEHIQPFFSIPLKDAAVRLGISMNSLKRACRKLGIAKWPYRQLKWLERNKSKMQLALRQHSQPDSAQPDECEDNTAVSSTASTPQRPKSGQIQQTRSAHSSIHHTSPIAGQPTEAAVRVTPRVENSTDDRRLAGPPEHPPYKRQRQRQQQRQQMLPEEHSAYGVESAAQHPYMMARTPYSHLQGRFYPGAMPHHYSHSPPIPYPYHQAYQAQLMQDAADHRLAYWRAMTGTLHMNPPARSCSGGLPPLYHHMDTPMYHHYSTGPSHVGVGQPSASQAPTGVLASTRAEDGSEDAQPRNHVV